MCNGASLCWVNDFTSIFCLVKFCVCAPRVQILSIACSFGKFSQIICWYPPEGWRPHLGEILDPPLICVTFKSFLMGTRLSWITKGCLWLFLAFPIDRNIKSVVIKAYERTTFSVMMLLSRVYISYNTFSRCDTNGNTPSVGGTLFISAWWMSIK